MKHNNVYNILFALNLMPHKYKKFLNSKLPPTGLNWPKSQILYYKCGTFIKRLWLLQQ